MQAAETVCQFTLEPLALSETQSQLLTLSVCAKNGRESQADHETFPRRLRPCRDSYQSVEFDIDRGVR